MYLSQYGLNHTRLRAAIATGREQGYGWQGGVLRPETASSLALFTESLSFGPNRDLAVEQHFDYVKYESGDWPEEIAWLAVQTERAAIWVARRMQDAGLASWRVNDVSIQRYTSGPLAIDWHRDFASDVQLVVIWTIRGGAWIDVEDYEGGQWRYLAVRRSVQVLRGPDPSSTSCEYRWRDGRRRHRVNSALGDLDLEGVRISIALRMNSSLDRCGLSGD